MMWTISLLLLATGVNCQLATVEPPDHCVHTNIDRQSADKVILKFMTEIDQNKDDILSIAEVFNDLVGKYDENGDAEIAEDEFVHHWHLNFKDTPEFAGYLFKHFDQDCNGAIGLADAPNIIKLFDTNNDQSVSGVEFVIYMSNLYYNCVPHYHQATCSFTG